MLPARLTLQFVILIIAVICATPVFADGDLNLTKSVLYKPQPISPPETIDQVKSLSAMNTFLKPGVNGLSFGWQKDPYWIKLNLIESAPNEDVYLEVAWPLLDKMVIYAVNDLNQVVDSQLFGDHLPFEKRPIFDTQFIYKVPFSQHNIRQIYFFVQTTSSLQMPINFWSQKAYFKNRSNYLIGQGFFYGLLVVMIFYNLFIYLSTHRVAYLHYVLFVSCFGILQAGLKGLGFQFVWPNAPFLNDYAICTGGALCLLFLTLFARSFLHLKDAPTLLKINSVIIGIAIVFVFFSLFLPYSVVVTPLAVSVILSAVIVIVMGTIRYIQGFTEARFYLAAWLFMVIGSIIYLFKQLGLLPVSFITENAMQIGSALEVVLLSLALADRLNTLRLRVETTNTQLEQTVEKRTEELVNALEELGSANRQLSKVSTTDKLTGLRNRYHFDSLLQNHLETDTPRSPLSLLLLDIDHFKLINDKWGHVIGDKALKFVSAKIGEKVKRQIDNVCRYGGEEFAIVLPNTDIEGAAKLAERIRTHIEAIPFTEGDTDLPITVSIGVASTEFMDGIHMEKLIRAADIALYKAKDDGRNCVHIFTGMISSDDIPSVEKSIRFHDETYGATGVIWSALLSLHFIQRCQNLHHAIGPILGFLFEHV